MTIGGNTSTGSTVDAERAWLIRDNVTGEEFNVVEFDVEQGAAFGVDTLSEKPLIPGRSYTVLDYNSNPDANAGDPVFTCSEFVCFAPGTMIATPDGERPVEALREGDLVTTLDNGAQPQIWTGARTLRFPPRPTGRHPSRSRRARSVLVCSSGA